MMRFSTPSGWQRQQRGSRDWRSRQNASECRTENGQDPSCTLSTYCPFRCPFRTYWGGQVRIVAACPWSSQWILVSARTKRLLQLSQ
eukprot:scaffold9948_cov129-Cylindrotheca_fusiformis.AAC.13